MSNIGSQITEAFAGLDRMEEVMALEMENENEQRIVELKKVKGDLALKRYLFRMKLISLCSTISVLTPLPAQ
jgi:ABC-type bacteriocin/lantibiotic exporter with double-glycine peptidase domain